MTFFQRCVALSVLCGALCMVLLFAPGVIFWMFGIGPSDAAGFMARRAAMLFLGISIVAYGARDSENLIYAQRFSVAIVAMMCGLATLGAFEFLRGYANWPILFAVLTEVIFARLYWPFAWRKK